MSKKRTGDSENTFDWMVRQIERRDRRIETLEKILDVVAEAVDHRAFPPSQQGKWATLTGDIADEYQTVLDRLGWIVHRSQEHKEACDLIDGSANRLDFVDQALVGAVRGLIGHQDALMRLVNYLMDHPFDSDDPGVTDYIGRYGYLHPRLRGWEEQ